MQQHYSSLTKALHWLSFLLIVAAYASMEFKGVFERGSEPRELMKASHYLFGLAILVFTVLRLLNRIRQPYPPIVPTPPVWQHKLAALTHVLIYGFLLLMPLLGSVAAFGLARSGQLLIRAIIGMALGFAYFVVDNAALAMGSFGGYPPLLAAWAPFLLFLLLGETVLIRTEE